MAAVLAFGMTPREVMLQQFGRADDPGSGGRQMPRSDDATKTIV
jgi:2-oxoisovalerate dehydrogenase E1 component alpha subunit